MTTDHPSDSALSSPSKDTKLSLSSRRPRRGALFASHQERRPQCLPLRLLQHQPFLHLRLRQPRKCDQIHHPRPRAPRLLITNQNPNILRHQSIHGPLNRHLRTRPLRFERRSNLSNAHIERHATFRIPRSRSSRLAITSKKARAFATIFYYNSRWPTSASQYRFTPASREPTARNHYYG
jgi:hypothetical protein